MIIPILIYLILIAAIAFRSSRIYGNGNDTFVHGGGNSPWYLVSIGMIGATISGISLVSVPGLYFVSGYSYMAMVFGFFFGYIVISKWLLPLYYSNKSNTIYGYFKTRFGDNTFKTISYIFFISKIVGASAKLFVALLVLHTLVFSAYGFAFWQISLFAVLFIWLYTIKGGIKTILYSDVLQTLFLIFAFVFILIDSFKLLPSDYSFTITKSELPTFIVFIKDFVSGIFVTFVMTGLDQEMMQKNLSCPNLKESQRNMILYGLSFIPLNMLLLAIGAIIAVYASTEGIILPQKLDEILPHIITTKMGGLALGCFVIGVVAASLSSADSAMTSLTTMLISLRKIPSSSKIRYFFHTFVAALIFATLMLFTLGENNSLIDTLYKIVGYTYGSLLGAFLLGRLTKIQLYDRFVPLVLIISPVITFILAHLVDVKLQYKFGYELLLVNAMITIITLLPLKNRNQYLKIKEKK